MSICEVTRIPWWTLTAHLKCNFGDCVVQNELRDIVSMLFGLAKLSLTARSHPDVVQNPATKPSIEPSGHAIAPKSLSRIELGRPGTNWDMPTFSVFLCSQAECRRFDPDHPLFRMSPLRAAKCSTGAGFVFDDTSPNTIRP